MQAITLVVLLATALTAPAADRPIGADLSAWVSRGGAGTGAWLAAANASLDASDERRLAPAAGTGIIVNGKDGRTSDLLTRAQYSDVEAHIEFLVAKGSNSGVYFQGRYEIQILDSWGRKEVSSSDCGGIYERWDEARGAGKQGFEGHAPRANASRRPGEWQSLDVVFRAPRFDANGKKIENARFLRVVHNGVLVQHNVELTGPTRAASFADEKATGPLMLQGDHGPVAFRNLLLRPFAGAAAADSFPREILDEDGFVSIFDGKSLAGWRVSARTGHSGASGHKSGGRWVVEDGAIAGSQDIPGNGGIIITERAYGDFEVALEMKNDYGPDSGLFLRSTENGAAYQYLVDYHAGGNLAGLYGEGLSPGFHIRNFNMLESPEKIEPLQAPVPLPIPPERWPDFWKHGQWNELRARIEGNPPRITTWINSVRFLEWQDDTKRAADTGGIALQVHGGGDFTKQFVRYRGMRVKELGTRPAAR